MFFRRRDSPEMRRVGLSATREKFTERRSVRGWALARARLSRGRIGLVRPATKTSGHAPAGLLPNQPHNFYSSIRPAPVWVYTLCLVSPFGRHGLKRTSVPISWTGLAYCVASCGLVYGLVFVMFDCYDAFNCFLFPILSSMSII